MIRYELTTPSGKVGVFVDSDTPDVAGFIQFSGRSAGVEQVRWVVERSYGAYGHLLHDQTTPVDLHFAMGQLALAKFKPRCVEGEELGRPSDLPVTPQRRT